MIKLIILPLLLLAFSFRADGPTDPKREVRSLPAFDAIEIGDALNVVLRYGPQKLRVEARPEILPHISTSVENGVLHLVNSAHKGGHKERVKILIEVERLKAIAVTGGANLECRDQITADNFKLELAGAARAKVKLACRDTMLIKCSGASSLSIKGKAPKASIVLSEASELRADNFRLESAKLRLSGAALAEVNVSGQLQVVASEAGRVTYKSKATAISHNLSGGASNSKGN